MPDTPDIWALLNRLVNGQGRFPNLSKTHTHPETELVAHLADTSDAHDASAISILDTANDFTATNVEDALQELQADNEAHVAASDPHTGYRLESADHDHTSTGLQGGTLTASAMANRTRQVALTPFWNLRTAAEVAFATNDHGAIAPNGVSAAPLHIDQANADASHKQVLYYPIQVPQDYVSSATLKWLFSSSAASNNAVFTISATGLRDNGTVVSSGLGITSVVVACPGSSNTIETGSQALDSCAAGDSMFFEIDIATDHASDTNTGTRALWSAWFEYTADS